MTERMRPVFTMSFPDMAVLRRIDSIRKSLQCTEDIIITSHGPLGAQDDKPGVRKVTLTGKNLKRASTNFKQGALLSKLTFRIASCAGGRINIIELGTGVGISGMYLLAGMALASGGTLFTFEGSPELAELARRNLGNFISVNSFNNVNFEIAVGPFHETLKKHLETSHGVFNIAFIDGNHLEEATIRYHQNIRRRMHGGGVVVHDDIGWSPGMKRAWLYIQEMEGMGKTSELHAGYRAVKGIVFLGADPTGEIEIANVDGIAERLLRFAARQIKSIPFARSFLSV